ncbi:hypothetical protein A1Q1_02056 [Trichosporon asahii var. asahii CBS 2479]|uniref:DUF1996 domain-containing protein n=1 Tax=Trichosporon asahii var. asahii (strain ATCC 90039 / CBS 2479 / JCM 2466 / KCTC 7840 / NBRC 103889/ NCYC 2677 / UAMH 7654) TaxID=1186058 RepID=J5TTE3_TRIAS|nr:hypothetical protein A1Q1_02056 [Trichosporon asahii var. asahii CBS 2479]EJT52721.1 hypothetical protein A1Q1_02056 [Trichosporon asahii var. asahii CBS 2479]
MVSFKTIVAAAAALLPAALADADHFILTEVNSLVQARIDPTINGGKVGSHVHNIMGASNFGTNLKHPDNLIGGAECTTVMVNDDKSNYWTPTLYYIHDNGTYEAMLAGARIYYFLKSEKVQPWPKGMRIVSGTAMSRDENAIQSLGVDLTCGETYGTRHLPNGTSHDYCDSIHAGIYFPSCGWANQSLDSWDHFSHLTWPIQRGGGREWMDINGKTCPESHPIKYPTMFIQHFYRFDEFRPWRKGRNNVVFSNGDLLGTSFHGDFVNGWKDGVLEDVVSQCKVPHGVGDQTDQCAPLKKSHNVESARTCAYQGMIPAEDVGVYRAIDKLPGCNPLWPVEAGDEKPKCDNAATPGWVKPNIAFKQGFLNRLPLYLPNMVPESMSFNWRNWEAGSWGSLFGNADSIQKPDSQAAQTEAPNDSVAGSQLNTGPVFDQDQPLDAPVIMDQDYATFPADITGTPIVTYKGMPGNVDILGNPIDPKETGAAGPQLDAGDKQKANAQPTAAPGVQFTEQDNEAAQNASASGSAASSLTASAASSTSAAASKPTQDENASWLDVPEGDEEDDEPASSAASSATSGSVASSASSAATSASSGSVASSASAAPTSTSGPKFGKHGKKCRPKGHKGQGHRGNKRRLH